MDRKELLTPSQIAHQLDQHIVGQHQVKRALAVALRNRWRRQQAPYEMQQEMAPFNILLIGPTGTGKTEFARRLAKIYNAPFTKVEATHFTERGYVGGQTDSMVGALLDHAVDQVSDLFVQKKMDQINKEVEEKLQAALLRIPKPVLSNSVEGGKDLDDLSYEQLRAYLLQQLRKGLLEALMVDITIETRSKNLPAATNMFVGAPAMAGMEGMVQGLQDAMKQFMPKKEKTIRVSVEEARGLLEERAREQLLSDKQELIVEEAKRRATYQGIIFIDEIDKLAVPVAHARGQDISREGVQRELLPLVEGTTVSTKYGPIKTHHILFIAAGAFHQARPSDLLPELQGRFPVRAELNSLHTEDFLRIMQEPKNALVKQYTALFQSEQVALSFSKKALKQIAEIAYQVNRHSEDIGARRLHTLFATLLESFLFDTPEKIAPGKTLHLTEKQVKERLGRLAGMQHDRQYII